MNEITNALYTEIDLLKKRVEELEAERDKLRDDLSRDKAILQSLLDREHEERKDLEEENRYLRAGCQDDTHQCPIVGTNNSLIERIAELKAENERLKREAV